MYIPKDWAETETALSQTCLRVTTGRYTQPIYVRCCAEALAKGAIAHGRGRRTADLKDRSVQRRLTIFS
jgi:hypothetical protein